MDYRHRRPYHSDISKNAQGIVIFSVSLAFVVFLVVSMVMFASSQMNEAAAAVAGLGRDWLDEAEHAAYRKAARTTTGSTGRFTKRRIRARMDFTLAPVESNKPLAPNRPDTADHPSRRPQPPAGHAKVPWTRPPVKLPAAPTIKPHARTYPETVAPSSRSVTTTTTSSRKPSTTTPTASRATLRATLPTTALWTEQLASSTANAESPSTLRTRAIISALTVKKGLVSRNTRKIIAAKKLEPGSTEVTARRPVAPMVRRRIGGTVSRRIATRSGPLSSAGRGRLMSAPPKARTSAAEETALTDAHLESSAFQVVVDSSPDAATPASGSRPLMRNSFSLGLEDPSERFN